MKPKNIIFNHGTSGLGIEYIKRRKMLIIFGWYDSCVGISPVAIPLDEFIAKLGIDSLKRKCSGKKKKKC